MAKGRKTGGRRKGSLNKFSVDVRGMILKALDESGGVEYLKTQAAAQPAAFIWLLGKTLPKDVNLNTEGGLTLSINLSTAK
jgi:hypothetical protein